MWRAGMRRTGIVVGSIFLFLTVAAMAQEKRSEISLQGAGFFTQGASGNGTSYSATQTAGFVATYRHRLSRWVSAEGAYGYDANTQKYLVVSNPFRIQSGIHQLTGSLVFSLPSRASSRFVPYFLAGGGALIFDPSGSQFNSLSSAQTQTKGAFVYGLGMNYALRRQLALRVEYRGLVYGSPDFGFGSLSTGSVVHTAIPSVGLAYRF